MASAVLFAVLFGTAVGISLFQDAPAELGKRFLAAQRLMTTGDFDGSMAAYRRLVDTPGGLLLRPRRVQVQVGDEVFPLTAAAAYQIASSFRRRGEEALQAATDTAGAAADLRLAAREYRGLWQDVEVPVTLRERAAFQVGNCLFKGGDYEAAVTAFARFETTFPRSRYLAEARYRTAWAWFRSGEWARAAEAFEAVAQAEDGSDRGRRSLFQAGEANQRLGKRRQALACFAALAGQFDPSPYEGKRRVREVMRLLRENLPATARELIGKAHVRAGDLCVELDSLAAGLEWYRLAASRFPTEAELVKTAYLRRAEALLGAGRREQALVAYREALEAVAERLYRAQVQVELANLYYEGGDHLQAARAYGFYVRTFASQARDAGLTVSQARLLRAESLRLAADGQPVGATADSLYRVARQGYEALLAEAPPDSLAAEALLGTGLCLQASGDEGGALSRFEAAYAQHPQTRAGRWGMLLAARQVLAAGDTLRADAMYRKLASASATEAADLARVEMAQVYIAQGRRQAAVAQLVQIDSTSTEYGRSRILLADLYGSLGAWERARQVLEAVSPKGEDREVAAQVAYMRARLAFQQGRYAEVVELLAADSVGLAPEAASERLYLRGVSAYEAGRLVQAAADLERYLATRPDDPTRRTAIRLLGASLAAIGDSTAVARLRGRRDRSAYPAQRAAWQLALGRMWYEAGQFGPAVEALQAVEGDAATMAQAALLRGDALLGLGNWEEAARILAECSPALLDDADAERRLLLMGVASMNAGDYEAAVVALRTLVSRQPQPPVDGAARLHLGQSLFALGRNEEAAGVLLAVAARESGTERAAEAAFLAGENLYVLERYAEAAAAYARVDRGRWQAAAALAAAWCQLELGDQEALLRQIEAVQARFPDAPEARQAAVLAGDYHYHEQDYPAARRAYQAVVDRYPDSDEAARAHRLIVELADLEADLVYQAAMATFDLGDYEQAALLLKAVARRYPGTLSEMAARCNLGVAYERLGKWHEAVGVYQGILDDAGQDEAFADMAAFAQDHHAWIEEYRL